MTQPILSVSQLVCGYETALIPPLNFAVNQNDIVAILGVNGRGKSTLLHTLLGIQPAVSGHIDCHYTLGFVPQLFSSTFHYSVLEIVLMGRAKYLGFFNKPKAKDIALALDKLNKLGIKQLANNAFSALSGGQRQLVLIARALTMQCKILLLDEPTSALDLHNQKQVLHILNSLVKEQDLTIIFSTHDPLQAMTIANKALLLEKDNYWYDDAKLLLTESYLSRLYHLPMKQMTADMNGKSFPVIVPMYGNS